MAEQRPGSRQTPEDEWGRPSRAGYEDRPAYQPRKVVRQRKGSRFLRTIGGLLVIAGMAWITYVATSPNGLDTLLKPGTPSPPILTLGAGLLTLLLERLLK